MTNQTNNKLPVSSVPRVLLQTPISRKYFSKSFLCLVFLFALWQILDKFKRQLILSPETCTTRIGSQLPVLAETMRFEIRQQQQCIHSVYVKTTEKPYGCHFPLRNIKRQRLRVCFRGSELIFFFFLLSSLRPYFIEK